MQSLQRLFAFDYFELSQDLSGVLLLDKQRIDSGFRHPIPDLPTLVNCVIVEHLVDPNPDPEDKDKDMDGEHPTRGNIT